MGSVLVLGVGPLPVDASDKLHAPGLRTWQIAEILMRHKHRVFLGVIDFGNFVSESGPTIISRDQFGERGTICRLRYDANGIAGSLSTLQKTHKFNCVISTTDIMNSVAACLPFKLPTWLDYNGDPFAEKQLQGFVHQNDSAQMKQWSYFFNGIARGDRFSTASTPQKYAMIGQLGFAGRLNQFTAGEDLVYSIPNCSRAMMEMSGISATLLKGRFLPADSRIVMWIGGYNTWSDPDTLFEGIEMALRKQANLYFVSTGGEIAGHDTHSFARFKQRVDASDLANRFMFLGWISTPEVPSYLKQADASICIDRYSYEGELGARTRLIDWMQFQTPIISTELTELTHQLNSQDLMSTFQIGNPASLCEAILDCIKNPADAADRALRARIFFEKELDEERLFAPLLEWAENPAFAGDRSVEAIQSEDVGDAMAASQLTSRIAAMTSSSKHDEKKSLLKRVFRRIKGA
jgi:glycosyltransferase involved in cell wall biosynthesis